MPLADCLVLEKTCPMQAIQSASFLSAEDYLAGELQSDIRHEYLGGVVYAMAGSSAEHNLIIGNLVTALRSALRGGPWSIYAIDLKVRVQVARDEIFYYPDLMVSCDPRDTEPYYKSHPKLIVEVLSPSTERTDRREKLLNYTQIETLEEYVLIAQDRVEVTVFHRANNWQPESLRQPEQFLKLASINVSVPLRTVYEDVSVWHFAPLPPSP
jgi:Uma2 family endonuclease